MTRTDAKKMIVRILEDIEPTAHDDSGLYIPSEELDKAADRILDLYPQIYDVEG